MSTGTIYQNVNERKEMILSCSRWQNGDGPAEQIGLLVNFKNMGFDNPKRITEQNTRGGKVFFFWRSKDMYSNEITTLSITGDTGNFFDPTGKASDEYQYPEKANGAAVQAVHNPTEKKKIFFQLLALSREKHYNDDGTENIFTIEYNSSLFSKPITFYGHYESGLAFQDISTEPFHTEFTVNFKVYYSEPDFSEFWKEIGQ